MNERIKLPAQEWLGYDPERGDLHGYTFEQMREFAELIVRACAQIGELKEQGHEDYDPDMSVGWYMRQHFGIPE